MNKNSYQINDQMISNPITVEPVIKLLDAQDIMRSWGVRHLPVVQNDTIVGILSDRDIFRAISLKKKDLNDLKVEDAMSENPFIVEAHSSLGDVVKIMAKNKIGSAIVKSSKGHVVGIFTTTDALNLLAEILGPDETKFRVMKMDEYLETYRIA